MAQQKPSFGTRYGLLYKIWVSDCIPNLGHAISHDFTNRPELYKQIKNGNTVKNLTDMQSLYGYAPNFPNDDIRVMLMQPIFGASDGHGSGSDSSSFQTSRMPVLAAAADYSENAQPQAFPMHRERIRSALIPFRRFMEDLIGVSLDQTASRMGSIFNTAASILRDPDIAARFSVNKSIPADWPLESTVAHAAQLIKNITSQLPDTPYGVVSQDRFVRMQRIAQEGCESIQFILDTDIESIKVTEATLDDLIRRLYAWGSDLGLIGGATPQ
ncbi:MAG: hypothetical protein GY801_38740 [bacterium]|nr:hypothetical protein [bacterium]